MEDQFTNLLDEILKAGEVDDSEELAGEQVNLSDMKAGK